MESPYCLAFKFNSRTFFTIILIVHFSQATLIYTASYRKIQLNTNKQVISL